MYQFQMSAFTSVGDGPLSDPVQVVLRSAGSRVTFFVFVLDTAWYIRTQTHVELIKHHFAQQRRLYHAYVTSKIATIKLDCGCVISHCGKQLQPNSINATTRKNMSAQCRHLCGRPTKLAKFPSLTFWAEKLAHRLFLPWEMFVLIITLIARLLAAKEWIAMKWMEIDQDYLKQELL